MENRLQKIMNFILELDKLKGIMRQTYILKGERKENDAEHSWHLAICAILLAEYSNEPVDILKVLKMVLLHDVIEIDAGDTYCYDAESNKTKEEREKKAAKRIYGLLPDDFSSELSSLWEEFELAESAEAKFAHALDRIQPFILNVNSKGISWKEHDVDSSMVLNRMVAVKDGSDELWEHIKDGINNCVENGFLKK